LHQIRLSGDFAQNRPTFAAWQKVALIRAQEIANCGATWNAAASPMKNRRKRLKRKNFRQGIKKPPEK
jgi:hypothetical protein